MKHYGDITKLSGYDLPVVDIITGGSPCQDLSVAGKRAGLAGERSGLFMEQIRLIKEMRERDRKLGRTAWAVRPRFMVWENVPGAFSSNGGKDFQAVLEEIVGVVEDDVPDLSDAVQGKWTKAGCLYDELGAWSIAWRVHDAQFWGVPQRRKRIALVADFGGLSAPEILFERKGLSWDSEQGGAQGQGAAAGTEGSAGSTSIGFTNRGYASGDVTETLRADPHGAYPCVGVDKVISRVAYGLDHVITTGGNCTAQGPCIYKDVEATLKAAGPHAVFAPQGGDRSAEPVLLESNQNHATVQTNGVCTALPAAMGMGGGYVPMVANTLNSCETATRSDPSVLQTYAMQAIGEYKESDSASACKMRDFKDATDLVATQAYVRRLTPMECERLQGFPDGWTDIGEWTDSKGKLHKEADSPRYKALGNSIALPFWAWLARRICAQYERPMTMASLFDGIGGFPLVFSRAGAVPVWASEIEEFPIAVTKIHFPEEKT